MLRRFTLILLLLTATVASAWEEGLAPRTDRGSGTFDVTVSFVRDRDDFDVQGRRLLPGSQETYLASADVVAIFRAARYWDPELNRLTLKARDRQLTATAGSRLVDRDGEELLLPIPVLSLDGDIWLPMTFVVDVLGPAIGEPVAWNHTDQVLRVGAARPNITGLRVDTGTRSTSLRIFCEEPLGWRALAPANGVVTLKVYGGILDQREVRISNARGLIRRVTSRQRSDHALIDVAFSNLVRHSHARSGGDGREIVLTLEETEVSSLPDLDPRGALNMSAPTELTTGLREIRTVVIDPGHGGDDTGRVSSSGLREKDVVLSMARRLKTQLEDDGFTVVMTRKGNDDRDLDTRAEIANRAGGDLFLSLHVNGWFDRQVRGIETHLLRPGIFGTDHTSGATDGETAFVPWDHVQWRHLGASREVAELVQARLVEQTAARDRGVRQTAQRVLRGVDMPAVVVEVGYLTNPNEADQLDSRAYLDTLAEGLALAVEDYRRAIAVKLARARGDEQ